MTIHDVNELGRAAIKLHAVNKDPLTASAAEILLRADKLPLTQPQKNAAVLIRRQLQAYACLHTEPLV